MVWIRLRDMVWQMLGLHVRQPHTHPPLSVRHDREEDDRKFEAVAERYERLMAKIRRLEDPDK